MRDRAVCIEIILTMVSERPDLAVDAYIVTYLPIKFVIYLYITDEYGVAAQPSDPYHMC